MFSWNTDHPDITMETRIQRYSTFLEDNDFEKWMELISVKEDDPLWQRLYDEWQEEYRFFTSLQLVEKSYLYCRMFHRLMWIRNRFNKFMSVKWKSLNHDSDRTFTNITLYAEYWEPWKPIDQLLSESHITVENSGLK